MDKREKLITALLDFGCVKAIKAGVVLTVFITGKNLSKHTIKIMGIVADAYSEEYPNVELMSNDEFYTLIILKK